VSHNILLNKTKDQIDDIAGPRLQEKKSQAIVNQMVTALNVKRTNGNKNATPLAVFAGKFAINRT